MSSQVSIIEGPPGTGKTQTIANIVKNRQTVAVVSNNNAATDNVYEKLQKYNLDYLCARLGKRENKEEFIKNQTGQYPEFSDKLENEYSIQNDLLDLGIPVSTFHSLGMKFIKKFYPYPIQVVGADEQRQIICNYIKELFKHKDKLKGLIELFKQYENKSYIAKGFIENFEKFDTFEDYFEDYKKRKYLVENNKTGGIHQYLINRLGLRNSLYTIRVKK